MRMICQAYSELLGLEFWLLRRDFPAIHEKVRSTFLAQSRRGCVTPERISQAVDLAAALYFKPVLCLQRSAAAACLLKRQGYPAEMVIGVQQLPFVAHAWVELNGMVLGDKPYMREIYSELSRC
jgi:transglutaminase superfamily protein